MSSACSDAPPVNRAPDLLARLVGSGRNFTMEVRGAGGTAVRSGAKIVDAYAYDLVLPASRGRPEERETVVYLVAEDSGEPDVEAALARLFEVAFRHSGQSGIVAQFLLAWWNGGAWGGFVVSDLFGLDADLAADIATVFTHLSRRSTAAYVDAYGFGPQMRRLVDRYRPRSDDADE